ncbi:acid phosphatase (class A) [Sphingomonas leidyi]|uniref:Acid phosphatase n=1 Tax=Sphingomonas leidyi TaxID=68569 RepID=A0A7X5ZVU5_9SPHN|nr:phosphatase PAP2 family protein [Sphingomonas leidyi]NIJ65129.1 acid phosphatase (class A) [Sphingomonas leidyi]
MFLRTRFMLLLAGACLAVPVAVNAQQAPAAKPAKTFKLLRAEDFPADGIVPAPPARGSDVEKLELAYLHALIAGTSPARMEQARRDDAHEDPSIFDQAMGIDLKTLPATWELLGLVHNDANLAANIAKEHFARVRPWGVDPTMPNCDAGKGKQPTRSYPSGHSTLGYSVGLMLATLAPAKARAVLDRARDYALSREICGVHFPSDTEASHVIASIAVARILASPAAAARIAAARAELARIAQ